MVSGAARFAELWQGKGGAQRSSSPGAARRAMHGGQRGAVAGLYSMRAPTH